MTKDNLILANSEDYNSANFSRELTSYAAGYAVDDVESILDFIAPRVPTSVRFEYAKLDKGAFWSDDEDDRAVDDDFKKLKITGEIVSGKLVNRGLKMFIDKDSMFFGREQTAVAIIKQRLLRNELLRAINVLDTVAATNKSWSGQNATNPDSDLRALANSVGDACGVNANKFLISATAWDKRCAYYEEKNTPAAGRHADFDFVALARYLNADKVISPNNRYDAINTTSGAKEKKNVVTSGKVYAFVGRDKPTEMDDSYLKCFVGEGDFKVYQESKARGSYIAVEHYSLIAATGVGACKAYAVS